MNTTTKKAPKLPTFYRTVTVTTVTATLGDKQHQIKIGGDVTMGQALNRIKETPEYGKLFGEDTPTFNVVPAKEEIEITIDDFIKYGKPRVKPEPKVEQVTTDEKPTA